MPLILEIKVSPASGRQEFVVDKSGMLKCFLKSVPEKGKANKELLKFLSDKLKIPSIHLDLISGHASRKKKVKINSDISVEKAISILVPNYKNGDEREMQCQIFSGEE